MKRIAIIRSGLWILLGIFSLGALAGNLYPVGYRVDWNIPFQVSALHHLATGTDGFAPWNYANLGSPLFYPTLAPFLGIVSLLSYAFPSAGFIERLIMFAAIVASAEAMYRLCRRLVPRANLFEHSAFIAAGVAFATGTYLFNKLSQGVLQESVGYAMLPVVANIFLRATESHNRKRRIVLAMLTGLAVALSAVQPQFAVLAAIVFLAIGLYHGAIVETAVAALSAIAAELYAVLPAIASLHQLTSSFQGETPGSEVVAWAPQLLDAVRQSGYAGNFDVAAIGYGGSTPFWYVCGYVLFAVAVLGFIAHQTRWSRLLALALCGTVIWSAMPKLYDPLYQLMLDRVPLAMMFRESYRFIALTALLEPIGLALAILWISTLDTKLLQRSALSIAAFVGILVYWLRPMALALIFGSVVAIAFMLEFRPRRASDRHVNLALVVSVAIVIIVGATPFAGYGLASQVQYFVPPASSYSSYEMLARQPGSGRVLYLPFTLPMRPTTSVYAGTDPTISWAPKESFGNYMPAPISKQFAVALYRQKTREATMEADWLDLQYVDARQWIKDDLFKDSAAHRTGRFISNPFSTKIGLAAIHKIGFYRMVASSAGRMESVFVRKTKFPSRFSGEAPLIVSGDINTAAQIYHSGDVVAFACQNPARKLRNLIRAGSPIVVEGRSDAPLVAAFAASRYVMQPGRYTVHVNADQGWASLGTWNSWWWLNSSITGSPCDVAMVARIRSYRMSLPNPTLDGKVHLLIEYWKGPTGGLLHVRLGRKQFALNERAPVGAEGYYWAQLSTYLSKNDPVILSAGGSGDAAVAQVALIPLSAYLQEEHQLRRMLVRTRIIHVMDSPWNGEGNKHMPVSHSCNETIGLSSRQQPKPVGCSTILGERSSVGTVPLNRTGVTSYTADVKGAGTFLLNTAFSPTWQISSHHSVHFVSNGYSNGWFVPQGRNAPHQIWNRASLLLTIGELLSGAFVIFVMVATFVLIKEAGNAAG